MSYKSKRVYCRCCDDFVSKSTWYSHAKRAVPIEGKEEDFNVNDEEAENQQEHEVENKKEEGVALVAPLEPEHSFMTLKPGTNNDLVEI